MITTKDITSRLMDVFDKRPSSNIGKICAILADQLSQIQETNNRIKEWRDIDKAKGTTLDLMGSNVGQARGRANDETYRIMIKSKIARNLSTSDINTIIRVLGIALNVNYSEIQIQEMHEDDSDPQPAAIKVISVPLEALNAAGMTPQQLGRIVKRTVAAGVRVLSVSFEGTFEFGGLPMIDDPNAGLASIDGTIGGALGAVYNPGEDIDLPI